MEARTQPTWDEDVTILEGTGTCLSDKFSEYGTSQTGATCTVVESTFKLQTSFLKIILQ